MRIARKRKTLALVSSMLMLTGMVPTSAMAAGETDTLLRIIVNDMGDDTFVTDDQYSEYFAEETAEEGVRAVVTAGNFYINGFAVPGTEESCLADYPDGYTVNAEVWLGQTETGWTGGSASYDSYEDAAVAAATNVPAGLETKLYDTDGDGYTDRIETWYLEAMIVTEITDNGDGTWCVDRGSLDESMEYSESDGNAYTVDPAFNSETVIEEANFGSDIEVGDVALFWYSPDGWILQRAVEVTGILVYGEDHEYYQIDDIMYEDAMKFSRGNVITSNRNGEFTNAHTYFGFTDNDEGLEIHFWLAPTTEYPEVTGAPIGMTTGENGAVFLEKAIAIATGKLESVVVSEDGSDVAEDAYWTTQDAYDELSEAIARAEQELASGARSDLLDYQVYLLYLTLNGTAEDIGAAFEGFSYIGFDHQIYAGTEH